MTTLSAAKQSPGVTPPAEPRRGLEVFVVPREDYDPSRSPIGHWVLGTNHRVSHVNSRSFYVYAAGARTRHLKVEWREWLRARCAEGVAFVDWQRIAPPAPSLTEEGIQMAGRQIKVDVRARTQRFVRASNDVLKRYRIRPCEDRDDGAARFELTGGSEPYTVTARHDWSAPPACTCPDASRTARERNLGYCKHVIAVLLDTPELRCQLLDILL